MKTVFNLDEIVVPALDTHSVVELGLFNDKVAKKSSTEKDIFGRLITPYASVDEFAFELRHTASGAFGAVGYIGTLIGSLLAVGTAVGLELGSEFSEDLDTKATCVLYAQLILQSLIQFLADVVTLPLSLISLIFRSIATAIDAIVQNADAILEAISYPFEVIGAALEAAGKWIAEVAADCWVATEECCVETGKDVDNCFNSMDKAAEECCDETGDCLRAFCS